MNLTEKINRSHQYLYLLYALWLVIYVSQALSPSSYGMALDAFHIDYHTLLGDPRPIRSDEWAVWTPYTQMAVANGFERFYQSGLYHIDLRNFNQIPLWDWSLIFKPLVWGYFILPPAVAFSLFYALMTVLFVIGWEKVIARFIGQVEHQKWWATGFTFLMYFTGYVQYWWTTTGPLLAFAPWLLLALFNQSRWRYLIMFYAATCWLLSHTYPPIVISLVYLGIGFIIVDTKQWNHKIVIDYTFKGAACIAAAALTYFYYHDVIKVMGETIYPGKRVVSGGGVPFSVWLGSIFPFIGQNNFEGLLLNICEMGTGASCLPLLAVCFVRNKAAMLKQKSVYVWLVLFAVFSLWMLIPMPAFFGKITLLSMVLENRLTFVAGFALNLAALFMLVHGDVRLSWPRFAVFAVGLFGMYALSTPLYHIELGKKSAWELLMLPVVMVLLFYPKAARLGLLGAALMANLLYNFDFNPIMPAKPIFNIINSETTQKFNAQKESSGWVVVPGYVGATLTGIGVDSLSTVLMQPQFEIFRKFYPNMPSEEFNQIFNRYAHIQLTDDLLPNSPFPDRVSLPLNDISQHKVEGWKIQVRSSDNLPSDTVLTGHIDSIEVQGTTLLIRGWAMTTMHELTIIGLDKTYIKATKNELRPDVAKALSDNRLNQSGFQIVVDKRGIRDHFCIMSTDTTYGNKALAAPAQNADLYHCNLPTKP